MKRTYFCPHCGATLNPNVKIVLTAVHGDERGLILLSPQPGNYKSIIPPELTLEVGDLLELYCPVCNADLATSPTIARVDFRFSTGTEGSVSFSRRYGEHATYLVSEDQVRTYGAHAEALDEGTNYFGVGRDQG